MKPMACFSVVGTICLVLAGVVAGQSSVPAQTYTVTVTGHTAPVVGGPSDHFLTFSGPVQVPKASLPAGTYVFKSVSPSMVQVSSPNRSAVYSTFFTLPVTRTGRPDNLEIKFSEVAPGEPPRIVGVYPEGSSTGYQPVYPKARRSSAPQPAGKEQ